MRQAVSRLENGGRYKYWPTYLERIQHEKPVLNRRFAGAVSETRGGKWADLYNVVPNVEKIDGLFSAFDLTRVGPRV